MSDGESVAISAVSGMGGIGKSELALQYLYRYQDEYTGGILWLDATSETFVEDIFGFGVGTLKLAIPQELLPAQKVGTVWANWAGTDPILVVLDNINTVKDFALVQDLLPGDKRFRVLVTSRVQLAGLRELPLDLLPLDKAVELLEKLAKVEKRKAWDRDAAETLCKRLGRLPLAVTLVGSYLGLDLNLGLGEMTALLEKKGLDARCLDKPDPTVAKRGVKAAFDLSWEHLTAETKRLACVLAMFARAPIEWRLVENTFIPVETEEEAEIDRFDVTEWRQELRRYSFLQEVELEGEGKNGYQLHPLIWEYLRQKIPTVLDETTRQRMVKAVVREAISIKHNAPIRDYEKIRPLVSHITEIVDKWVDDLEERDIITPCTGLARFYKGFVDYEQAKFWLSRNVHLARKYLSENHPSLATSLNNLAGLYRAQGKYSEAEPLYKEALTIARGSLWRNHPLAATYSNNLAELCRAQGKDSEAELLYKEALTIARESLPKNHPLVATYSNNLAELCREQGKASEAEPLYKEALTIARESLPKNHPLVATILNNLATLHKSKRQYFATELLYKEALAIDRESLRKNHPDLAGDLNNLAELYRIQGKYSEAEPLYQEALAIFEESLGLGHPNTCTCHSNYMLFLQQKANDT